jgi:hypothetical protein
MARIPATKADKAAASVPTNRFAACVVATPEASGRMGKPEVPLDDGSSMDDLCEALRGLAAGQSIVLTRGVHFGRRRSAKASSQFQTIGNALKSERRANPMKSGEFSCRVLDKSTDDSVILTYHGSHGSDS